MLMQLQPDIVQKTTLFTSCLFHCQLQKGFSKKNFHQDLIEVRWLLVLVHCILFQDRNYSSIIQALLTTSTGRPSCVNINIEFVPLLVLKRTHCEGPRLRRRTKNLSGRASNRGIFIQQYLPVIELFQTERKSKTCSAVAETAANHRVGR